MAHVDRNEMMHALVIAARMERAQTALHLLRGLFRGRRPRRGCAAAQLEPALEQGLNGVTR